nr:MAG TPA: hypothetical protein [Caudoviricetes sp.]
MLRRGFRGCASYIGHLDRGFCTIKYLLIC